MGCGERGRREERGGGHTHPVQPEGGPFLPVDQHTQPETVDPPIVWAKLSFGLRKNNYAMVELDNVLFQGNP